MVALFAATMTATGAGAMIARGTSNGEDVMCRQVARSNIVVGVGRSSASDAAVRWATREAIMRVVPIKLINVLPRRWSARRWPRTTPLHKGRNTRRVRS